MLERKFKFSWVLLLLLILLLFSGCSNNEVYDCPDYTFLENYSINDEKYVFGINKDKRHFGLIDSKCYLKKDNEALNTFYQYFIGEYVGVIEKTPYNEVKDINDVLDVVSDLLEEPIPKTNNSEIEKYRENLLSLIKEKSKTSVVDNIQLLLDDYEDLYIVSIGSNVDGELSSTEIVKVKSSSSIFIYDVLDKAGLIEELEKTELGGEISFYKFMRLPIINFFTNFLFDDYVKKKKKEYYTHIIKHIIFDKPIEFFYYDMKKRG